MRLKQPEDDFPAAEELTPSEDDDLASEEESEEEEEEEMRWRWRWYALSRERGC